MKPFIINLGLCSVVLSAIGVGCSSSDTEGGDDAAPGSGGEGPVIVDNSGGSTDIVTGRDGGSVDLTPEQVESIETAACKGWAAAGEAVVAALQLVVDVSSSMREVPNGSGATKWESTRDALMDAIVGDGSAAFPGLASSVPVGVLFYPNVPSGQSIVSTAPADLNNCVNTSALIPLAPLGDASGQQRSLIKAGLESVQLSTGTPTNDAYDYALASSMLPFQFSGNRYMLLITDGTPTISKGCVNPTGRISAVDPQPVVDAVAAANAEHGIKTFVIGSPGSEDARASLSAAARLGGTAASADCSDTGQPRYCHLDMTTAPDFSAALRNGLGAITGALKSCVYDFPEAPEGAQLDLSQISVIVHSGDGAAKLLVPDDTPDDCTVGFKLSDGKVELCSQSCAEVQSDLTGAIELMFGCSASELVR